MKKQYEITNFSNTKIYTNTDSEENWPGAGDYHCGSFSLGKKVPTKIDECLYTSVETAVKENLILICRLPYNALMRVTEFARKLEIK